MKRVVIVGRPNVGKSTLFNRLTGGAHALVFDRPGVTRDVLEVDVDIGKTTIKLTDTAGWPYPSEDAELTARIHHQVERHLKHCSLILWVVDGRAGRTGADDMLAQRLMPFRKKILLLLNKLEPIRVDSADVAAAEFAGAPFRRVYAISAKHGEGLGDVLTVLEEIREGDEEDETETFEGIRLAVMGKPNVGKSTLINRLVGHERLVVAARPGTTRDSVRVRFRHKETPIELIDTAGLRRKEHVTDPLERTMTRITVATAERADVVLLMLDLSQGLTQQDLILLGLLHRRGKVCMAAVNKWDLADDRSGKAAQHTIAMFRDRGRQARIVPIRLISAKTGHGVAQLLDDILAVHARAHTRISTPKLNQALHVWNTRIPGSLFDGKPGKLKYAVQTGVNPVSFKIFMTRTQGLRDEGERWIERQIRDTFGLEGIPIQIHLEQNKTRE